MAEYRSEPYPVFGFQQILICSPAQFVESIIRRCEQGSLSWRFQHADHAGCLGRFDQFGKLAGNRESLDDILGHVHLVNSVDAPIRAFNVRIHDVCGIYFLAPQKIARQ